MGDTDFGRTLTAMKVLLKEITERQAEMEELLNELNEQSRRHQTMIGVLLNSRTAMPRLLELARRQRAHSGRLDDTSK